MTFRTGIALGLGAAVCAAFFSWSGRGQGPPRFGALPAFSLSGHDGSAVSRKTLGGRPWVADFIFTRCGSVCPAMTTAMAGLQRAAPADLGFVSFTVDPGYDTAEVLARYAAAHHAKPGWVFVTGAEREIHDLAVRGFHLGAARGAQGGDTADLDHSAKLVLVDSEGVVRGYYDSDDVVSMRRLLRDAALVGRYGALPRVNATLNATSAALLGIGYLLARRRRFADHRSCMAAALLSSGLFLTGYLYYHAHVGSIRYAGEGLLRSVYLAVLGSHTVLAAAIVPLVLITATRALRERFDAHRRIGRVTLPAWIYVSVTGVTVYWMLYRI